MFKRIVRKFKSDGYWLVALYWICFTIFVGLVVYAVS